MNKGLVSRDSASQALIAAKREARERFLTVETRLAPTAFAAHPNPHHNVVGVGLGAKLVKGKATGRKCVRFYVERKLPKNAIPTEFLLPSKVREFATDVIETFRFRALPAAAVNKERIRLRPAQPGCSVGFAFTGEQSGYLMAGTLGAVVEADGQWFILSNNHVLADQNKLPLDSVIFQPGLLDKNSPRDDQIAKLSKFVPLKAGEPNMVDCAIAQVLQKKNVNPEVMPKVGKLKSDEPVAAVEGMAVEKTGRTTGYTTGTVRDVSADVKVDYDIGPLIFSDQIIVVGDRGSFSDAGDSGSLIVDRNSKRPVGLLFGGSPSHTIANHIGDVLQELGVKVVVRWSSEKIWR